MKPSSGGVIQQGGKKKYESIFKMSDKSMMVTDDYSAIRGLKH